MILTEGVDGVVPVDYFHKIESWPSRQPIPFFFFLTLCNRFIKSRATILKETEYGETNRAPNSRN